MAPAALLHLLSLLGFVGSLPPPRTSFLLNSTDRPLVYFSLPDVHNTTTLLLSPDASTLYVGARDIVLSLDVSQSDVISLKKKVEWRPSDAEIHDCQNKGKNSTVDCPNFVRVLQPINSTHLYACGSYAYGPHDVYIDTESFAVVRRGGAKGRCPFSPFERSTALTVDGELFAATTVDFRGVKPQISRHFSKDGHPDVSQDSSVSLLEEPTFVSSVLDPAERKLYFFFSEVGKEFSFVDKLRIARVAQVCKDDVGGLRTLQKKWTSFAKAPLLCQAPGQLPYNVLQDVFTLRPPEGSNTLETLFYGVFTSQWPSGAKSAVCIFRLQDVRTAFTGRYRTYDMGTDQWSLLQGRQSYLGTCGLENATDSELAEVKKSFLTSNGVKPVENSPIVVSSGKQYSRIAVMRTKAANGTAYTILFLLTESGFLHKVVLFDQGPQIIEEIQVFTQPQLIKSIILSSSKGVLYVGTSEGVTAVPTANCSIYRTCSQCVLARDPLCGWSLTRRTCIRVDSSSDAVAQDLENGNVEERCQSQPRMNPDTVEVSVALNRAVRLQCVKPSNLATLTWTSSQIRSRPENFFIQSSDGSLSFLASDATFGSYHCEAEEGGYKEVVASYNVRSIASPRSMNPSPNIPSQNDESYEDIRTVSPLPLPGEPECLPKEEDGDDDKGKTDTKEQSEQETSLQHGRLDTTPTCKSGTQSMKEPFAEACKEKSYYSELVVVSLLLVTCICILTLGGLHVWRQRRSGLKVSPLVSPEEGSQMSKSGGRVPSLSTAEYTAPELKVVE